MTDTSNEETQVQEANESEAQSQPRPAGAELNINDLVAVKNIIEIASTRGAFKANELEVVGKTFNKLNTFLESVAAQKEQA